MKFCGPEGIRTLDLFSAIDEQVGEKGEKAVYYVYFVPKSPYNSLRSLHAVTAYLYPNCSRIVHAVYPICIGMKQGKAIRCPVLRGINHNPSESLFLVLTIVIDCTVRRSV